MKRIKETINYATRLTVLKKLAEGLPQETMTELLENGRLDEYYGDILEAIQWLNKMIKLQPNKEPYAAVKTELDEQREGILLFYQKYFSDREHDVIGSSLARDNPDFVFALSCNSQEMLRMRVEGALKFAEKNDSSRLILCGGGFHPILTDAEIMNNMVAEKAFPEERIIFEDDSIDTIGNALFSKLILKQKQLLPEQARLVIATSAFHAVRSLNLFRKIYGPNYDIAVAPIKTVFDNERQIRLVAHELSSDNMSSREIFSLRDYSNIEGGMGQVTPGDEKTIFFQLLLNHNYYLHRYDLTRKYADVLDE